MEKPGRPLSCDVCQRRSISKLASSFCPHCEDGLCPDCFDHHGASRSTSFHHIIPIDEYQQLPPYVISTKHRCGTHKSEFEFYCFDHAAPCCVDCTKDNHSSCLDLKPLHDVVRDVKKSTSLQELERSLSEIVENIVHLTKDREDNIATLDTQKAKTTQEIKRIRLAVNDHLDKIEQTALERLTKIHDSSKQQIEKLMEILNERKEKANIIQEEMALMKQAASNLQTYIAIRDLEKRINREGKTLIALQEDENFYQSDIGINYSEILTSFSEKVPYFGEISIESSPKNLSLVLEKTRKTQIVSSKLKSIEEVKTRPCQKIRLRGTNGVDISGCEIMDNGKLLFIDWKQEKIITCNNDASENSVLVDFFGYGPFDVTCIADDKIAVSLKTAKMIAIVEYPTGNILKKIKLTGECFGIDHKEGKILVRLPHTGIFLVVDLKGKVISRIRFPADRLRYFTLYMDKIYSTITSQNTVICMNMKGLELWTYRNVLLREPFGITVDPNGFVYVAGRATNNVIIIAPDGRRSRVILTEKDGIVKPQALYISKFRNQILVSNKHDGSAYLFDL